jgi:hypothetical protein
MKFWKFFSLMLLISLLVGGLLVDPTAAGPLALVAVAVPSSDALPRFQSTGLPAYALLDGYILAGVDSAGQSVLRDAGLTFQILDAELSRGYYIASRMPSSPRLDWSQYGRPLLDLGDQVLLQTTSAQAERLSLAGAALRYISLLPIVLPVGKAAGQVFPEAVQPDPFVQVLIDRVSQDALKQLDRQLAGVDPVWVNNNWYTITSRHTYSGTPIRKAAHFVGEFMADRGLDVEYQVWYNDSNPNVIGQITGLTDPGDIFIIGGHLDDVLGTPGADDNASGSAAAMLAADLLSQYRWNCTLRFAFWTGEEQGYYGSAAYAWRSYNYGENIIGYLNLDMIAYNSAGTSPGIDLVYHPYMPYTQQLAQLMSNVIDAYNLDLVPQLVSSYGGFSDHSSFWDYGYTSIHAIEDQNDFNPYYHSSGDTPGHMDLAYLTEFSKASLATFLHMSGCLSTGSLSGRVTSALTGTPITNANLHIENKIGDVFNLQTADDGYYNHTLPVATYTVTVSADGYLTQTLSGIDILNAADITQDFSLQPVLTHGFLEGHVTSASTGDPLPSVSVIAFSYGDQVITASDGYYSMTLTAGDYLVTAKLSGYFSHTLPTAVTAGQSTLLDFALQVAPPEIDIIPSTISTTLLIDQSALKTATVRNLGHGPLDFTITNPDAAAWLSFTPQAGQLDPAATQGLSLALDAAGLGTGVYPTTLEFASNDPASPLVVLPVTMQIVSDCVPISGAYFIWMPLSPLAGQAVTFYPMLNGSQPISFNWEFSDGTTSTAESPVHIFAPGVSTVTLTATNDCGVDNITYALTIVAPPWRSSLPLLAK